MLTLSQISKSFQQKTTARDISFSVGAGSITAILGASGSGKSTLLNIIAGLVQPDSGEVYINGEAQNAIAPERRHVAMMFQDFALLPHLNVWQNAAFGLRMRGVGKADAREQAQALLGEVGMGNMAERHISALSGGEKQRVALARALAGTPKVLLLDEPFSSLDTTLRSQLQSQTRELVRRRQIPAVLVTHDPAEACFMADNIALLAGGELLQHDTPEAVLRRPANAQAARLLGCLNVSDAHYIPPEAIHLSPHSGTLCTLQHSFRLPIGYRIEATHPHFGAITFFHDHPVSADDCRVAVDASRVVAFD